MENNQPAKRMQDSYVEQAQIVNSSSLNGNSRLFGGQLMQWIDEAAGVCARRHSGRNVTTALVEKLQFKAPAHMNDLVILKARVVYTGNSSMEVCVRTYVEALDGAQQLINEAFLILVALDEDECPVTVPRLILETEEQKREWEEAKKRRESRSRA
jgi:acyl-CoA hydrolase